MCVRTVQNWRNKDADFAAAVDTSRAWHLAQMAGYVAEAAPKDWRAAKFILERAKETREHFGERETQQAVTVNIGIVRGD